MAERLYLVTGGAGHLGTAIITQLVQKGCRVRALCLPGEKHLPVGATPVYGDVCKKDSLSAFFADTDQFETIVIHCAGVVSIASEFVQQVYDVNVGGTRVVTDLCAAHHVKKLIYVSSVHAIPELPRGNTMNEIDHFSSDEVVGLYAKTKAEATAAVLYAAGQGLDAEVVFPSGIIGPYDYGRSHTNQMITDYLTGRLTSAIKGGYDFVDVRDVASGIIACAERGKRGEGYILSGGYHTIRELLEILHELTGHKEIKRFLPIWFVNTVAPLCELYYKLLKEPPLFTKYSIYTLSTNASFSNAKANTSLGYRPRDIRDSLRDTVQWLQQIGSVPQIALQG